MGLFLGPFPCAFSLSHFLGPFPWAFSLGLTQRKSKLSSLGQGAKNMEQEVRLLSSPTDWEIGVLSSVVITFQRDDSQVLEKDSQGL